MPVTSRPGCWLTSSVLPLLSPSGCPGLGPLHWVPGLAFVRLQSWGEGDWHWWGLVERPFFGGLWGWLVLGRGPQSCFRTGQTTSDPSSMGTSRQGGWNKGLRPKPQFGEKCHCMQLSCPTFLYFQGIVGGEPPGLGFTQRAARTLCLPPPPTCPRSADQLGPS